MNFLVQCPHLWHGIRQRPHHLMSRFAQAGHRVHWVEPRYLRWLRDRPADFRNSRAIEPQPGLRVRPVTLINGERFPPIRAHNKFYMARAMRAGLAPPDEAERTRRQEDAGEDSTPDLYASLHAPPRKAGPERGAGARVLWIYNPHEAHLARSVPHDLLVYDIMDDYTSFPWSPRNIRQEEEALLKRADWVFAGTHALYESRRRHCEDRIECILSGVETEHFMRENTFERIDEDYFALRRRYQKVFGYAGMIDLRIDQPLIARAAWEFPRWGFVLIGPVACDVAALKLPKNVHLVGPREYSDLPGYYHSWDGALLPFVDNALTRAVNPTKMLEYAAADVPIIARRLPEIEQFYGEGAFVYDSPDQFFDQLRVIGSGDVQDHAAVDEKKHAATAWVRQRSWDTLARQMLTRVEDLVGSRKTLAG